MDTSGLYFYDCIFGGEAVALTFTTSTITVTDMVLNYTPVWKTPSYINGLPEIDARLKFSDTVDANAKIEGLYSVSDGVDTLNLKLTIYEFTLTEETANSKTYSYKVKVEEV